jgi:hypothetical protein
MALEERLDRGLGDQRGGRTPLGEATAARLDLVAGGEDGAQREHRSEADRGVRREEPRGRASADRAVHPSFSARHALFLTELRLSGRVGTN